MADLAVHHGHQHGGRVDVLWVALEDIAVEHDEISELADLYGAHLVVHPDLVSGTQRVSAHRLGHR